jgi:hypothetical protein
VFEVEGGGQIGRNLLKQLPEVVRVQEQLPDGAVRKVVEWG